MGDKPTMTLTADKKGRLTSRQLFPPGSVFAAEQEGEERVVLKRLREVKPNPSTIRISKENGYTVFSTSRPVSMETVQELLSEFP